MTTGNIEDIEKEIIDEFNLFDNWSDKYQYLIEIGNELKEYPEDKRDEAHRIKGCQSSVWLTYDYKNGKVFFKADSDSSIVKGLVALLIRVLSGQKPETIFNAKLDFIDKIGLTSHLAQTRANGLASMIKQMKSDALTLKLNLETQHIK